MSDEPGDNAELRSWGESYTQAVEHSASSHCPKCYWAPHSQIKPIRGRGIINHGWFAHILGFSLETPGSCREGRMGSFIIECPNCFTKYFFHASLDSIRFCKESGWWPAA